ncbi:MAG: hypothetical protein QOJ82_207 [Solirubrobacteraceae bacterium]|jgi:hypothetical protein|nr:hypothetical protein [Solirubrobacteraceae bacterium]
MNAEPTRLSRGRIGPMRESNVELARRGYEAALRGDLDVISGLLDPRRHVARR